MAVQGNFREALVSINGETRICCIGGEEESSSSSFIRASFGESAAIVRQGRETELSRADIIRARSRRPRSYIAGGRRLSDRRRLIAMRGILTGRRRAV